MEAVMDIANEVEVMSEQKSVTRTSINKDEILKLFTLENVKPEIKNVKTQQPIHKPTQEKQIETIKNKLANDAANTSTISNEEIELRERLKAAEEAKMAEEARLARIRQLEQEARIAEQEAELARKKREAEQRRIEEEQRLRQLRAEEEARKREEAERERIRLEEEQRLARIRQEQAKLDRMRAEQEMLEKQRIEQERLAEIRRKEQERLDAQKREQERLDAEKKEKEAQAEKKRKEELLKQLLEQKKKDEDAKKAKQKASQIQTSTQNKGIDKLKSSITNQEIKPAAQYEKYSQLDIDALYAEVRKFLKKHNVEKKIVDIKILEDEFGKPNIKKLILKSYLISIGKGVTVGR